MASGKHILAKQNAQRIFGTAKVGDRGQIVIPKEAREFFSIESGDTLLVLGKPETGLLAENKADGLESEATGVLGAATGNLESETTGLLIDENATAPLDTPAHKPPVRTGGKKIEIIEEVMFIHTDEVIG